MMVLPQNTFAGLSISGRGNSFVFLSEMFPIFFCCCICWSDYFCRCSNSKYLPWLSQLLKISVIIKKDWMEKGSYFSFSSQWESQQVSMAYDPCRKWAVGLLKTPACQPPFVPPTSSHHTTRRQISTFAPLKLASVEGSKLTHENLGISLTAIHSSPSSSCS